MPPIAKANQQTSAIQNRRAALQLLGSNGQMSRQELAQFMGLQSSTMTYIIRDLIKHDVVCTVGKKLSHRAGKKQELLQINPDLGWVVGAELDQDSIAIAYLDACGQVIERDRVTINHDLHFVADHLKASVAGWLSRHGQPPGELLGLGVGVSGVVNNETGMLLRSTFFDADDLPLRDYLEKAFGVTVVVDNNANFSALAEVRSGMVSDYVDFLYFHLKAKREDGMVTIADPGSALFIDGKLYRGAHFAAGEIDAGIDRAPARLGEQDLLIAANQDGEITPILEIFASRIGQTLASAANLFDPQAVVLGGNVALNNKKLLALIQEHMNEKLIKVKGRQIHLRGSRWLNHGVTTGAAVAAIDAAMDRYGHIASGAGRPEQNDIFAEVV